LPCQIVKDQTKTTLDSCTVTPILFPVNRKGSRPAL
jgi:hypothetical protein